MAHPRQEIREAVKAALVGKTAAGTRVFETQMLPFRRVQLPAITVYALSETIDPESQQTAPRELTRNVRLEVVGVVEQGTNVDDAMDDIALDIEKAMHADPNFGGKASDSILSAVELQVDEENGQKPLGLARLIYAVTYHTDAPAAADLPPLADFSKAHVATDLGGTTHPDNQAVDDVAVPIT